MICKSNKFSAIHNLKDKYPISILCEIAGVSRSGYYNWLKLNNKPDKDTIIKEHILEAYNSSKNTYGYRRICVALYKHYNIIINHKKVLRLMRKLNIKSLIRRKRFKYNIPKFQSEKVEPNILNRDFTAIGINTKWSTDITYLYYGKNRNRLYLSAIKDLYNNEIISYEMSTNLDISFVLNTVKKAIAPLSATAKESLIIHSDQGTHYTCIDYKSLLRKNKITQSMSRRGNCYDNACIENFFGHLKSEEIHLNTYESKEDLEAAVHSYIYWYNNHRFQSKLKNRTPIEYRCTA